MNPETEALLNGKRNQIISFSGGKDSTAMLLMMLERNEPIHSVVFFDTGWEFPQMPEHIDLIEQRTGIEIVRLNPERTFDYWMYEREIVARKGPQKGRIHRIGNGWPSATRRWCTRQKVNAIDGYAKTIPNHTRCIGFAKDEEHRQASLNLRDLGSVRYPLIEWGVTEAHALRYCQDRGYDWGGLYDHFARVSCFCCPLQRLSELRKLRTHYPELWQRMLDMDARIKPNRGFHHYATVHDLERRFADELRLPLFAEQP